MTLAMAQQAEQEERWEEAVQQYEQLLLERPDSVDVYVHLLTMYWQMTDFGLWTGCGIPQSLVRQAGVRLGELMEDSTWESMRGQPEPSFWVNYIQWTDWGVPYEMESCRQLMEQNPDLLEPVVYRLTEESFDLWESEVKTLLTKYKGVGTLKAKYVVSYLEAAEYRHLNF